MRIIDILTLMAVATLAPLNAHAQKPDSGAFIVRLGTDTIAVERYVRTPHKLVADALLRTPQTRALHLTVNFNRDGSVANYEILNRAAVGVPNAPAPARTFVRYIGDSARIQSSTGQTVRPPRTVLTRGGMLPEQQPFYSTYEAALAAYRKTGNGSHALRMFGSAGTVAYQVHWVRDDSVTLSNPAIGTLLARMDRNGRLLTLSGANTTFKVLVTRTKWLDISALEKRFAAADVRGKSIGVLSPRDTTSATLGGNKLLIDYSRPSKRGRIVFGGIVPWGQVWRTGANAATQIEFGAPVDINGVAIPAGKYTLWSIPDPRSWQIIINRQTGQWGTDYEQKHDLARIRVNVERLSVPVEMFTIALRDQSERSAVMTLSWDRTRVVVPIKLRAGARASAGERRAGVRHS